MSKSTEDLKTLCNAIKNINKEVLLNVSSVQLEWREVKSSFGYDSGDVVVLPFVTIKFK